MSRSRHRPVARFGHEPSACLEPSRLGVRFAPTDPHTDGTSGGDVAPPPAEFAADDLSPGPRRLGPFEVVLGRVETGTAATLSLAIENRSDAPIHLESVVLGFRLPGWGTRSLRYLRHGWQSWSFSDSRELDGDGAPAFPSGGWLRGMHHALGTPAADRAGWHESDTVTLVGPTRGGPACVLGALEAGGCFGVVYLKRDGEDLLLEIELCFEISLEPGEGRAAERVHAGLANDPAALLESFGELWGRDAGARTRSPFQAGWCSWYHFFHDVEESDLLRNLEALAAARDEIPVDVVQLDDGYQHAIGDWLETNAKFPRGLAPLARDIRDAGFRPGLWTAPFCVAPESRLFEAHPDWLLRDAGAAFRGLIHPKWSDAGWIHALDTTRPDVLAHLEDTFRALSDMGFTYLKLDFLYVVSMRARAASPAATRAQRLRAGLKAVRAGAGSDAFLLGCGCPLGPAVGLVDGMRIGPDVAPHWEIEPEAAIPGLEPAVPSVGNAVRNILSRVWMHRRIWLNDPDCLMVRRTQTRLRREEAQTLASAISASGGMLVFSDDVPVLDAGDRGRIRDAVALAREVDAAGSRGAARLDHPLDPDPPRLLRATRGSQEIVAFLNTSDREASTSIEAAELGLATQAERPVALLGARDPGAGSIALSPHETLCARVPGARSLAVFCDFDGTFSVQDVGATLARQHLADRRAELWSRYERGDSTAWEYNQALLDGFELPEADLHAFLETIDLDAGAGALVTWCEKNGVPFRVLSDGFDYNLDRLQDLHGVRFEYRANRLRYESGRWRIAAGAPNSRCGCGTGTCKRGQIDAFRAQCAGAFCVHIGNGRVSDLCGALAADLAFAKDTLVGALEERGAAFEPFETLHDVVAVLDRWLTPGGTVGG